MKHFFLFLLLFIASVNVAIGTTFYNRQALTGGATGALDEADGADLSDGDLAVVSDGTILYHYRLDATSGASESSPDIIAPDTNPGDKRWLLRRVAISSGALEPPTGVEFENDMIAGLYMSNDAGDTDHDLAVSAGAAIDSTGLLQIKLSSAMTKQIDATWAAGDDAGGLLNGTVASSGWYNVYLLRKDADGTGDVGFLAGASAIASYLPSGYSAYRWIGFIRTDGSSNIIQFIQNKNHIIFEDEFTLGSSSSGTTWVGKDFSGAMPIDRVEWFRPYGYCPLGQFLFFGMYSGQEDGKFSVSPTINGSAARFWSPINPHGSIQLWIKTSDTQTVTIKLKEVQFKR